MIAALRARNALVGEHRHDGPPQALSDLIEVPALVLGGLPVSSGDPEIEGDASAHWGENLMNRPSSHLSRNKMVTDTAGVDGRRRWSGEQ